MVFVDLRVASSWLYFDRLLHMKLLLNKVLVCLSFICCLMFVFALFLVGYLWVFCPPLLPSISNMGFGSSLLEIQ